MAIEDNKSASITTNTMVNCASSTSSSFSFERRTGTVLSASINIRKKATVNAVMPTTFGTLRKEAVANAITKVAKSNNSSEGSTLYITTSPCMECAKLIIQAGITRVVYEEKYRITDGLDLLERATINMEHIEWTGEEEKG